MGNITRYDDFVGEPIKRMIHGFKRSVKDKAKEIFSPVVVGRDDYPVTKKGDPEPGQPFRFKDRKDFEAVVDRVNLCHTGTVVSLCRGVLEYLQPSTMCLNILVHLVFNLGTVDSARDMVEELSKHEDDPAIKSWKKSLLMGLVRVWFPAHYGTRETLGTIAVISRLAQLPQLFWGENQGKLFNRVKKMVNGGTDHFALSYAIDYSLMADKKWTKEIDKGLELLSGHKDGPLVKAKFSIYAVFCKTDVPKHIDTLNGELPVENAMKDLVGPNRITEFMGTIKDYMEEQNRAPTNLMSVIRRLFPEEYYETFPDGDMAADMGDLGF
jgi:hypothetical protein